MSFEYKNIGRSPLKFRLNDLSVFFNDEQCLGVIDSVLDENGNIKNFPGVAEDERWQKKLNIGMATDVRFEARFYSMDNDECLMLWLVQPSGWEWVDEDGFGFTDDSSITLYSIINKNGEFTKEFELFSIDRERFCNDFDNL